MSIFAICSHVATREGCRGHPSLNTEYSDHVLTPPFLQSFHRHSLCLGGSHINYDLICCSGRIEVERFDGYWRDGADGKKVAQRVDARIGLADIGLHEKGPSGRVGSRRHLAHGGGQHRAAAPGALAQRLWPD